MARELPGAAGMSGLAKIEGNSGPANAERRSGLADTNHRLGLVFACRISGLVKTILSYSELVSIVYDSWIAIPVLNSSSAIALWI